MLTGNRILMVDDEVRILELFSASLEDSGYYVKTASDGYGALVLVSEETFDIVFLDQFLGTIKGLDLMQKMSEINPELNFVIITANGNTDLAVESLKRGVSDFISKPFFVTDLIKSIGYVNKKQELDKQRKELLITLELKVDEQTRELKNVYFSVLSTLAQAMEKKNIGTYGHCMRVSYYSKLIAAAIDLNERDIADLKAAAMLHDIGKIGISDFILGKCGLLDNDEIDTVRSHPQKGVEILKPLRQFEHILPAILHHHENYDGSGYPAGLSGESIPLLARIIAVADAYDAILSNRPYRTGRDHAEAMDEIQRFSGRQFDNKIVDAFFKADKLYNEMSRNRI